MTKAWWSSFYGQQLREPFFAWRPVVCPESGRRFFLERAVRVSEVLFVDPASVPRRFAGPYELKRIIPFNEWDGYGLDMMQDPNYVERDRTLDSHPDYFSSGAV